MADYTPLAPRLAVANRRRGACKAVKTTPLLEIVEGRRR